MRCDEFELVLQQHADRETPAIDELALRDHARQCAACRELEDGFRLLHQAFAVSRMAAPPAGIVDQVVAAHRNVRPSPLPLSKAAPRRTVAWIAAAAALILAAGTWLLRHSTPGDRDIEVAAGPIPAAGAAAADSRNDEPLFAELASNDTDSRDDMFLAQAVQPVSDVFRSIGRSLSNPFRPIATATSQAIDSFLNDRPEPDLSMIPGMPEMMGPMKKKMPAMMPSS